MYAVLRVAKLKTMGEIGGLGHHNERTRATRNADEARRGDNDRLAGTGDWIADAQARLNAAPTIRSNAVLAIEHVLTASRDFYAQGDAFDQERRLATWTERSMDWLRERYGAENVVAAVLHRDEITPHIQALVVPIDDHGRLNARAFTGGREKLARMQDSYAAAMRPLGLERGVKGSVAAHQTVKEFYAKIEAPTPAKDVVREQLAVDKPGRIVTNPDRWASEQHERIAERLTPTLDAALVKARHYEGQAARAEANIVVMQQQVRDLQRERDAFREDYRALAAQVRSVDLPTVIERLGGQVDRYDAHKWHLAGEHISITGERFYNHDRQQGGGGAIDLVMHAAGYDDREAVAYLRDNHGADAAVTAATWQRAREAQREAQEIVRHAERAPVLVPDVDEDRWPRVRAYLTEERGLPPPLIDALHPRRRHGADLRRVLARDAARLGLQGTGPRQPARRGVLHVHHRRTDRGQSAAVLHRRERHRRPELGGAGGAGG